MEQGPCRSRIRDFLQVSLSGVRSTGHSLAARADGAMSATRADRAAVRSACSVLACARMVPALLRTAWVSGILLLGTGCGSLVDLDVDYRDCVPVTASRHTESFEPGTSLQDLRDRCWQVENPGTAPGGLNEKFFVDDGDLVLRVFPPADDDFDQWSGLDQGPMIAWSVPGDFVAVARVEALRKSVASHCLDPGEGAGLAVRRRSDPSSWATWLVEPFLWERDGKKAVCAEDTDDTNNPSVQARAHTSVAGAPDFSALDFGADGEADIALCRIGAELYYFLRAGDDPKTPVWVQPKGATHTLGSGVVEVGLTASGVDADGLGGDPGFHTEAHFAWVVFNEGPVADGCVGALESIALPEGD